MLKEIELTHGQIALVSEEDYDNLSKYNWYAVKNKNTYYAYRGKNIAMHREITNCPSGCVVDHKDGNGLNNSRDNLRVCSVAENNRNNTTSKNKNGYKGIYANGKGWAVKLGGKYIGQFKTQELAAKAYDEAAKKEYGDFASLNF